MVLTENQGKSVAGQKRPCLADRRAAGGVQSPLGHGVSHDLTARVTTDHQNSPCDSRIRLPPKFFRVVVGDSAELCPLGAGRLGPPRVWTRAGDAPTHETRRRGH